MKSVVGAGVVAVLAALSVSPSFAKGKTPKIPIWDSASACRDAYATSPVMLKECNDQRGSMTRSPGIISHETAGATGTRSAGRSSPIAGTGRTRSARSWSGSVLTLGASLRTARRGGFRTGRLRCCRGSRTGWSFRTRSACA